MYYCTNINDFLHDFNGQSGFITPTLYGIDFIEFKILLSEVGADISKSIIRFISDKNNNILKKTIFYDIMSLDYNEYSYFKRYVMSDQKIVSLKEDFEDYSDDSLFNINSWGADLSFRELVLMYDDEELIKPELQRKYVWTKEEASMFIDSILLGLPVPSIFLAKVVDQKLIIDGYQRLMTVYDYVKGIYSATGKIFKLSNSEAIHATWRGKAFSELSKEEQRRINSTTIHAIIFEQKHPANDSGMYKIFERINTSGRNLKPQEIRNCVYHGKLNDLLFKLNKNEHWRSLWGKVEEDSRMLDMEFILRFFMIENLIKQHLDIKQISLKKELNVFMADEKNNTDEALECFENKFTKTVEMIYYSLGEIAFRNISLIDNFSVAKFAKSIHPAIFDALMVACSMNLDSQYHCSSRKLTRENYISLLNNNEFVDCISIRTTNTDKIIKRIELASTFLFEN